MALSCSFTVMWKLVFLTFLLLALQEQCELGRAKTLSTIAQINSLERMPVTSPQATMRIAAFFGAGRERSGLPWISQCAIPHSVSSGLSPHTRHRGRIYK